jgi:hypothetical protein
VSNTETKVARKNAKGEKMVGQKKTTKVGHRASDGKETGAGRTSESKVKQARGSTVKAKKSTTKVVKKTPRKH